MIVIEKSEKPVYVKRVRCTGRGNSQNGCNSLLEITIKDLVYWPGVSGDTWGSRDPHVSFRCCVCKETTDIPKEDWPYNIDVLEEVTSLWYYQKEETNTESEK